MNFKQMMMEKLKENVAYKVANDATLIREVADTVMADLDYSDIASDLNIRSSDIANEIDQTELLSEMGEHIDMDEIRQAVADRCDMNAIAGKVVTLLHDGFIDELAGQAADEITREMAESSRI